MDGIIKGPILGKGSYGVVYSGVNRDKKNVVLKEIILNGLSDSDIEKSFKEVKLLSTLKHPHIIKYYGHSMENKLLTIVMEYATDGTLKDYLGKQQELLPETQVIKLFSQLLLAVEYVHNLGIVHRDICDRNVLIAYNDVVKLGDFGVSRHIESWLSSNNLCGHPGNLAPELCHGGKYSRGSDMWAIGCILYELATLNVPFKAPTIAGLLLAILQSPVPDIPIIYNRLLQTLVGELFSRDPGSRPTAKSLLAHPLLAAYIHALPLLYHDHTELLNESDKELLLYFVPNMYN